jgi:hypothetical protein
MLRWQEAGSRFVVTLRYMLEPARSGEPHQEPTIARGSLKISAGLTGGLLLYMASALFS